jgi:hypothetical protein
MRICNGGAGLRFRGQGIRGGTIELSVRGVVANFGAR